MRKVFEETQINGMALTNRLVRSATWEGMCEPDGRPTPKLKECYADLSRGGVGLLISGCTFVCPEGKGFPGQMGIQTDAFATDMNALTASVHDQGGKICMQLHHAGGQTSAEIIGGRPVAPSAVAVAQFPETPAELSSEDIAQLVAQFSVGAKRAREYGFDAVQLHAAHGYLINQFLSPLTNRRSDIYGGSLENRLRFLMEVYRGVRSAVGNDFPVLVKLNGDDNLDGGLGPADALHAAMALDKEGVDAIEISAGTPASGDLSPVRPGSVAGKQEAFNLSLAGMIKKSIGCPVMTVGGIRSIEVAEEIVREGEADYISMSRPFIREPGLAKRWQSGDRTPATCISCNGCFKPGLKEGGIYCVVDKNGRDNEVSSP
jgi:2,4-dienoyl-CoA reductase-like NADH-dependent reductase (Old Yellow Enzyme family)